METTHTITARQARELGAAMQAANAATDALRRYFSAVADSLDLPEGTTLVRLEETTLVVTDGRA